VIDVCLTWLACLYSLPVDERSLLVGAVFLLGMIRRYCIGPRGRERARGTYVGARVGVDCCVWELFLLTIGAVTSSERAPLMLEYEHKKYL